MAVTDTLPRPNPPRPPSVARCSSRAGWRSTSRSARGAPAAPGRGGAGRRRARLRGAAWGDAVTGGGVGLRQDHHRPADHPAAGTDGWERRVRGPRHHAQLRPRAAPAAPRHRDGVPGPLLGAQPAAHDRHDRRGAVPHPGHRAARRRPGRGAGPALPGRAQPRALQPLPARVLRRPAPAHRDRPHAGPAAQADRGGRAGVRAGRVDPGAGGEPPGRPADASSTSPTSSSPTTCRWSATSATGLR